MYRDESNICERHQSRMAHSRRFLQSMRPVLQHMSVTLFLQALSSFFFSLVVRTPRVPSRLPHECSPVATCAEDHLGEKAERLFAVSVVEVIEVVGGGRCGRCSRCGRSGLVKQLEALPKYKATAHVKTEKSLGKENRKV